MENIRVISKLDIDLPHIIEYYILTHLIHDAITPLQHRLLLRGVCKRWMYSMAVISTITRQHLTLRTGRGVLIPLPKRQVIYSHVLNLNGPLQYCTRLALPPDTVNIMIDDLGESRVVEALFRPTLKSLALNLEQIERTDRVFSTLPNNVVILFTPSPTNKLNLKELTHLEVGPVHPLLSDAIAKYLKEYKDRHSINSLTYVFDGREEKKDSTTTPEIILALQHQLEHLSIVTNFQTNPPRLLFQDDNLPLLRSLSLVQTTDCSLSTLEAIYNWQKKRVKSSIRLTKFSFSITNLSNWVDGLDNALNRVVIGIDSITSLNIQGPINQDLMRHLETKNNLESLSLRLVAGSAPPSKISDSVTTLTLQIDSSNNWVFYLGRCLPSKLVSLELFVFHALNDEDILSLVSLLQNNTLKYLTLSLQLTGWNSISLLEHPIANNTSLKQLSITMANKNHGDTTENPIAILFRAMNVNKSIQSFTTHNIFRPSQVPIGQFKKITPNTFTRDISKIL
ncbi:hypothetical protein DFA_06572 [Cavenderia fasciculata]|uniref:F-box domain-containing protein n=1 Tax=Cavenderia fasciculata TaxID=261658 RepID=F4PJD6_CACFS|nr:uncharacterized protein DFA_06572 [Cavenderia fasciculata]EGG24422.1 hypothetical protein DFA_06572 [Cavenderia fasciculata]|eukprot:XP_004362273.1 hypothetical protein DFA_06572 [Cavenderia fasciculata]